MKSQKELKSFQTKRNCIKRMRSNHMGIKLKKVEIVKKKFNSKNYLKQNKQQIKE
jgi:hypothetical protein